MKNTNLQQKNFPKYETNINKRINQIGNFDFESRLKHYRPMSIMDPAFVAPKTIPFDPTSVGTLYTWYDCSDLSTITKDGGDLVSQINDKSGNAQHLTQGTGASQPLWKANQQNGKDAVEFVTGKSISRVLTSAITHPLFQYIVMKTMPDTGANQQFISQDVVNGIDWYRQASNVWSVISSSTVSVTKSITQKWVMMKFNGTTGASAASLQVDGTSASGTTSSVNIDRHTLLGSATAWQLGEMLSYESTLTAGEQTQIQDYLTAKWNVT